VRTDPLEVHSVREPVSRDRGRDPATNWPEPGESLSRGLYSHHDREEVFRVEPGGTAVGIGREGGGGGDEPVRFAPEGISVRRQLREERVVGRALGAPGTRHDWGALESVVDRPEHGENGSGGGSHRRRAVQADPQRLRDVVHAPGPSPD
jgi:hypothetical protein